MAAAWRGSVSAGRASQQPSSGATPAPYNPLIALVILHLRWKDQVPYTKKGKEGRKERTARKGCGEESLCFRLGMKENDGEVRKESMARKG